MLVLSRKPGECIIIGDMVRVTVTEVRGDRVKLSFEAPLEISIHREEVYRRIMKEHREKSVPRDQKSESQFISECT